MRQIAVKFIGWTVSLAAILVLWVSASAIAAEGLKSSAPSSSAARITILYDAFGKEASFQKDWGYSALIEISGKRILFDTGDDSDILAHNAKAAGVDLSKLDFVVMSHRHGDHIGGMSYLLSVNPKVKIYAPEEFGGVFGYDLPSRSYRKDDKLPAEMRYFGGNPPAIIRFGKAWAGANIELIDKSTEILPGITLIAQVSDAPKTRELKELSLAINTPKGLILIVGCAHPGIENIVAEAARINPRIHVIAGGFHLLAATDPDIARIVTTLHDTYHVEWIAPGHCTGEPTFAALKQAFGEHYLYAGLGTVLNVGDIRSAESVAWDQTDHASYRRLLEGSDDSPAAESQSTEFALTAPSR
ncbi:MBL fold metallo-hydrolase [Dyella sp. 2HG41-7]|uniref:MBL fold metallo-hydrolase n=1 Tax=Dyella sp. 2HG41-7 TaxID=2883239 RepID=UPI001F35DF81|nr:MBL fold metallo-hydrolase [Dyella sp. 2HG41-7]